MGKEIIYIAENVGDWGIPEATPPGSYGTDTLVMADGTEVFYRHWRVADPHAPVLVFLHGLGAHTGWFIDMGNELNSRGLNVYMDDHRGFGRSGGGRGHVRRGSMYLRDIQSFLGRVKSLHPEAPLFLCGHSMGGVFAIYVAAADAQVQTPWLHGLILINPWIKDSVKVKPTAMAGIMLGGISGSDRLFVRDVQTQEMTRSPEAVRLLNADSYWVRHQSQSFLYQITLMRQRVLGQARKVRAPALVIQTEGDETLVQPATRQCYLQLGSKDKTWKTYPGFAHDFEFEPGRGALDADLADWILAHAAHV
ncbi:MAG: alpha/beta fold hydrolase [Ktedonobacterales bacterium]